MFSDEELSEDDFFDDEEDDLMEETLLQIKHNDPNITSLAVHRFPNHSIAVEDAGRYVGESTYLKKLAVNGESMEWEEDVGTCQSFLKFSSGFARNRSMEHFSLTECSFSDGGAVSAIKALTPLFEHNMNLHSIDILGCAIGDESTRLLASALSRRVNKSSLRCISLDANKIGDGSADVLVEALEGHHNLVELSLGDNEIGRRGCIALRNFLSSSKTKLNKLNLENNQIGDDEIALLMDPLCNSKSLRELSLSFNSKITQSGWRMFSACLQNGNSAMEKLDLSSNNVANEGAIALGNALTKNTKLKTLNLYDLNSRGIPLVTATAWKAFFACLRVPTSGLRQIDLRYSSIDERGLVALADALASNSVVKMLDLSHNNQIPVAGWQSFFACLKTSNFAVKELYLQGNNITDEAMFDLKNALDDNETLETLVLEPLISITNIGWAHFRHLLCDRSSIMGIYASNHTLRNLGHQEIPSDLHSLLLLNQSGSNNQVAREKILQHHFQNGETNIHEFLDMELKVMPNAISWMSREDTGQTLLYQVLRSLPSLLVCENTTITSGAKRKRFSYP